MIIISTLIIIITLRGGGFYIIIKVITLQMHSSHSSYEGVTTQSSISEKQNKQQLLRDNKEHLLQYIRENIVGSAHDTMIRTVYGEKPMVYADYTASGRTLRFIEDYIATQVQPIYANTHSLQSATGKQTNLSREEARHIIKRCCGADELDAAIFCGTGSTSAINLLIHKMRVQQICE